MKSVKEQLQEIKKLERTIDCKQMQLLRLRSQAEGLQGVDTSRVNVTGGKRADKADVIIKITELDQAITDDICEMITLKRYWRERIKELDRDQANIIETYYFQDRTWEQTAIMVNVSYRHMHRLHGAALKKLSKIAKDGTKWH